MTETEELNPYQSPRSASLGPEYRNRHDRLTVVASFETSFEAQVFCDELSFNGIDAKIVKEYVGFGASVGGIAFPGGVAFPYPVNVLVRESRKRKAIVIKELWLNSKSDSNEEIPAWTCQCGEKVDAGFAVCWNCEARYG